MKIDDILMFQHKKVLFDGLFVIKLTPPSKSKAGFFIAHFSINARYIIDYRLMLDQSMIDT